VPRKRIAAWFEDSMNYFAQCDCGRSLEVGMHQAGTETTCDCGLIVAVPPLSKLRESVGIGAYESGIINTIERMIDQGELPHGDTCAISGMPTEDTYSFYVQCESSYTSGGEPEGFLGVFVQFFVMLIIPFGRLWR
jgi:hypothetical protein